MQRAALTVSVLLAILLAPSRAGAVDDDVQFWPVLTLDHGITEDWGAHLQSRVRLDEDVSHFKDWMIRAYVTWNAWRDFHVDFGYDHIGSNDGSNENRFWLLAEHVLGWRELKLTNRIRFDQRWVEDVDGVVSRFRYRLRGIHPIPGTGWYGALSNEVFVNVNDQGSGLVHGFEQNRFRIGAGSRFFGRIRAEPAYEWQYIESRSDSEFRHVFLLELSIDTGELRAERRQ